MTIRMKNLTTMRMKGAVEYHLALLATASLREQIFSTNTLKTKTMFDMMISMMSIFILAKLTHLLFQILTLPNEHVAIIPLDFMHDHT